MRILFGVIAGVSLSAVTGLSEEKSVSAIPDAVGQILSNRCYECHDELSAEGDIMLDQVEIDWSDRASIEQWHKAINVVTHEHYDREFAEENAGRANLCGS
ncbi:MAG: hypothetical protein WD342_11020 [Verrucomicrobiales bacterium]